MNPRATTTRPRSIRTSNSFPQVCWSSSNLGLEEFEASAGDAYEPWRHEAVESRPSEKDVAEVAECITGGYRLKSTGAVVRKAKCVVDLAKEKEE